MNTPVAPDMKHLHHLVQRLGCTAGQAVFVIHVAAFCCGLVGVTGWALGVSEPVLFGTFVAALLAFIGWTNWIWRRIDREDEAAGLQAGHGAPGAQEEGAVQGAGGAPDRGDQGHADLLEQRVGAGEVTGLDRVDGGCQAALHVGAVVGVADGGVQVRELLGMLSDELGGAAHPGLQVRHRQRLTGVCRFFRHIVSPP